MSSQLSKAVWRCTPWMNAEITLAFEALPPMPTAGGVAINSFKQTLHLPEAVAQDHNVVGLSEVGHTDVGSN